MPPFIHKKVLSPTLAFFLMTALIFLLPLAGAWLWNEKEPMMYLQFPPRTFSVQPRPFNAFYFCFLLSVVILVVTPFILKGLQYRPKRIDTKKILYPAWGWISLFTGIVSWFFAWAHFDWFITYQMHTFIFLWGSYIVFVNSISFYRSGRCLITHQTKFFFALFLFSAIFWWYFEYLNRFAQNWHYPIPRSIELLMEQKGLALNELLSPFKYALYASLSFSTVLPGVMSTKELLDTFPNLIRCFKNWKTFQIPATHMAGLTLLLFSALSLFAIGSHPDYSYPMLWLAPGFLIIALQLFLKKEHIFEAPSHGDWSSFVTAALSALICGFFWEMWNYYSDARWIYNVPFVNRFHIFEMPILGYAGYLPFGVECLIISRMTAFFVKK